MAKPCNNPFVSITKRTAGSGDVIFVPESQTSSLFVSPATPTLQQMGHHFSPESDASYPSLFDYSLERRDRTQSLPPATRFRPTVDITTPAVPPDDGRTLSVPLTSERPSRQVLFQIAKEAQARRDRSSQEASATISQPRSTMAAEHGLTSQSASFDATSLQSSEQTRPPDTERRSSLRPSDLQLSTPVTRDVPSHHEEYVAVFAHMAVNDTSFTPKPFKGNESDSEKAEEWIEYFTKYTKFRQITGDSKMELFCLLMTDQAADWLRSLDPAVLTDFESLLQAFRKRYSFTDIDRWRKASFLWSREQKSTESVDTYITDIQNAARVVPVTDPELLRMAILKGLKPAIRLHVLQTKVRTLQGVIDAARVAEAALFASAPSDDVGKLTDRVELLLDKMEAKSSTLTSSTPVEGDTTRRVTFATLNSSTEDRRSTSPRREYSTGRSPTHGHCSSNYLRSPDRSSASCCWDTSSSRSFGQSRDITPPRVSSSTNMTSISRSRSQSWQPQPRHDIRQRSFSSTHSNQHTGWTSSPSDTYVDAKLFVCLPSKVEYPSECYGCAWSRDGNYFAWSRGQRKVNIVRWNQYRSQPGSPDGSTVVTIDAGGLVHSLTFCDRRINWKINGRHRSVESLSIQTESESRVTLVTGLKNGRIRLWDAKTGVLETELCDHTDTVTGLTFSSQGRAELLSSSLDGTLKLWDLDDDGNMVKTFKANSSVFYDCSWSPDGATAASVGNYQSVQLWNMKTRTLRCRLEGHRNNVTKCEFSPDGILLATSSYDSSVIIWNVQLAVALRLFEHCSPPLSAIYAGGANGAYVTGLCFSSDGYHVATACEDGFLRVWDIFDDAPVQSARVENATVCSFSADGSFLAVGTKSGDVSIFFSPMHVASLQHLCRLTIQQLTTNTNADVLHCLPPALRRFLQYTCDYMSPPAAPGITMTSH